MRESYRAILKGDRLQWQGGSPAAKDRAVAVRVTLEDDAPQQTQRGTRMAAALEQLAASHAFAKLDDPAAWERHLREERELPNRS